MRSDGESEHGDRCQAGHEDRTRVGKPGDERVAATEPDELLVRSRDSSENVVLAAVRDELGSSPKELDELAGQLPARCGLPLTDEPGEPAGEERHRDPAERETDGDHCSSDGKHERDRDDASGRDREGDERRREAAQVDALERVDVTDHSAYEVAPSECVELGRRERLDALVNASRGSSPAPAERGRATRGVRGTAREGERARGSGRRR